ncbi:uncharacterized protein LOC119073375 isoform X2 [Bradysia coprophila]|uniref:uncharacterized protein LOC119073375 isoform X2 n=1 Tax=Bradysia coprophila TaxID=38358 RepID=UPI00187DC778|nr:uncharacterized protein LOC119073375 isoform X2 [Bradysia coprophila]
MSFLCGIRWMKQKFVSSSPLTVIAFMLILKLTTNSDNGIIGCDAAPSSASLVSSDAPSVLEMALKRVADTHRVVNLTRQHGGDVFSANVDFLQCETDTCVGLSSGTAGLYKTEIKDNDIKKHESNMDGCRCQCLPHLTTFREDLNICVDDIHECTLAPFVSGSSSERIPFVFLPLHSQIIHPSKEISFQGVKAPICAVSSSQYLTTTGWSELRNPIDTDVPFRLFRDEGRTFLQWLGDSDLRHRMQGRLILVHLMCRDMAPFQAENVDEDKATGQPTLNGMIANQNIFSPCVAFRVVGTPVKHINNVTEVSFQLETNVSSVISSDGLSTREYVVISACTVLLGLIYVASVFLYLHVKKRKSRHSSENNSSANTTMKNDQVTFGPGYKRNDSITGFGTNRSGLDNDRASGRKSNGHRGIPDSINGEEIGIVKNNPLLRHYPSLSDNSGFTSDLSNSNSECDDDRMIDANFIKNMHSSIMIHQSKEARYGVEGSGSNPGQETECLPEENVSIVEDLTSDDKLENMKAIVNGTMRRKLYFNPAYFEPHLLMSPPAAAVEFLTKIREVITIAKYKMATKRYQPSLIVIPEENVANGSETYANRNALLSRRSSVISSNTEQTRNTSCAGCPGCDEEAKKSKASNKGSNCRNCGDKRNSIRKWLEDVSMHEGDRITEIQNEHNILDKGVGKERLYECNKERASSEVSVHSKLSKKSHNDSSSSSDSDTIKANSINSRNSSKRKAPPIPANPPKVISHFLKPDKIKQNNFNPIVTDLNVYDYEKSDQTNSNLLAKNSMNAILHSSKIYDKSELYSSLSIGSELYNNPQFTLNSPQLSQRSRCSQRSSSKSHRPSSRSRTEVLDQFSNPQQIRHYEAMKKLQQMPDMVYEAMANDFNKRKNHYGMINVPTPDYDETLKKWKPKHELPYVDVPTPDYNTYGRSKKIHPPDSPIYSRKSPQHLIVDYETDSLERSTTKIGRSSISPPSNNSDLSSQPSPSLSVALPLEEEVEVRNTVYDRVEGSRQDGDELVKPPKLPPKKQNDYNVMPAKKPINVSEAYLLSNLPVEPRIKYDTPHQGSMTIEVEHNPTDCESSTDSEQFEQDTLDRKPRKVSTANKEVPTKTNGWPQHLKKSENFLNQSDDTVNYSSLENMTSLPDMKSLQNKINTQLVLRSNGSFKSTHTQRDLADSKSDPNKTHLQRNLNSLRQIYESKIIQKNSSAPGSNVPAKKPIDNAEIGRLLTLEARHSKRQRKTNPLQPTLKKAMPPDLIPFSNNLYDSPKSPVPVDGLIIQKNLSGWNTDDTNRSDYTDAFESTSSESTEITGVSDTQANSEFESEKCSSKTPKPYSQVSKLSKFHINNDIQKNGIKELSEYADDSGTFTGKLSNEDPSSETSTLKSGSTNFNFSRNEATHSDTDKIEILSSKSLSIHNVPIQNHASNIMNDLTKHSNFDMMAARTMPTKIFRVDVNPSSHGMQIALGLKDRAKKSKDLKNAWKKFVSKFQSGSSNKLDKKSDYEGLERASALSDDGISSMPDESITVSDEMSKDESGASRPESATSNGNKSKTKSDFDGGYLSADSSESRHNKKLYERFNFKSVKANVESNTTDNDFAQKNVNRMQEIKETTESEKSFSQTQSPVNSLNKKPSITGFIPKSLFNAMHQDAIQVNVYSSDDERYSSCGSTESDEEYNLEDMCESGAESIETNSVFFKNVRKNRGKDELK